MLDDAMSVDDCNGILGACREALEGISMQNTLDVNPTLRKHFAHRVARARAYHNGFVLQTELTDAL